MAGSSVLITRKILGDVTKITFKWLSDDTTGAVNATTTFDVVGFLMRVTTVPDVGGTTPTTPYTLILKDEDGLDVLNGLGALRSTTLTEHKVNSDGLLLTAAANLTLTVTNAGNGKGGVVYLYFMETGRR